MRQPALLVDTPSQPNQRKAPSSSCHDQNHPRKAQLSDANNAVRYMKSLPTVFNRSKPDPASLKRVADLADQIENQMRRIGYWKDEVPEKFDTTELYAGVSFEKWLQFVFLPQVRNAVKEKDRCAVPPYRVGVAALRQYDYHSSIPEAHALMLLCHQLEDALPPMEKLRGPDKPVQKRPTSPPV